MLSTLFDANGHDRDVTGAELDRAELTDGQLLWIDLTEAELSDAVKLPFPIWRSVQTLANATDTQFSEEAYAFRIELSASHHAKSGVNCLFVVGKGWLVTVTGERPMLFDDYVKSDRGEGLRGRMTAFSLAASLLAVFNEDTRKKLGAIENQADKLDEEILRAQERKSLLLTLATLRRRLSYLRQTVAGQRAAVLSLSRADALAQIMEADHDPIRQVRADYERLSDEIMRVRETIVGSFELYTARVAHDANRLLKALTIATVITGVVGAVAGIFGMNFNTAISQTGERGFHIVTWTMIAGSIAFVVLALWRRWF